MDLVLDEVVQLEHVDVADGDVLFERPAGAAVAQLDLAALGQARVPEGLLDRSFLRAVEDRRRDLDPERLRGPAEMGLEDLPDVHPARHAERVEDDVDRCAVRQVRHVLDREDLRDDALVAVTAGHLVDADELVHAGQQLVVVLAREDRHVDDLAVLARREPERGVLHLTGLLPEDRAEQTLLGGELGLALRRDLAHEDVLRADLGADVDDAVLVEIGESLLTDVRDVTGDLFGAELRVTGLGLVLLDVDRRELVVLHDPLGEDDRVLVVTALPGHERHEDVLAERELALVGRVGVGDHRTGGHALADRDDRPLVVAGALVRADELLELVAVGVALVLFDPDLRRRDRTHRAGGPGDHDLAGVLRRAVLDPGADDRRLGTDDRDGLTLHVRAHEGAVRVVVLEERDERRGHGHDLLRRDVHVLGLRRLGLVVLGAAMDLDALVYEEALRVEARVRLDDGGELLLVGGEVDDLVGDARLAAAVLHDAAVGRLDESVGVHPAVRRERADEADVRTLRRLDRADPAVVAVVDVADVEAGALARQAARPEGREAALVGELVERVRLLHELREL